MLNLFVGFKHIINREDEEEENRKKKISFCFISNLILNFKN